MLREVCPVFALPEELNPHLVRTWVRVVRAWLVSVAVEMSNIAVRLPEVQVLQNLDEKSLPGL